MRNIHYVAAFDREGRFVSFFQCSAPELYYDPQRLLGTVLGEHLDNEPEAKRIRATFAECVMTGKPQHVTWIGEYGERVRARFEKVEQSSDRQMHSDDEVVAIAVSCRLPEPVELSKRELEVVQLICKDLTATEIAAELGVKTSTVETHRQNIRRKLRVKGTAGIVLYAINHGILDV